MPVSPDYIKKTGNLLLDRYPEAFVHDFEQNKKSVDELTSIESKDVRNRVAGYVTRKQRGGQSAEEVPPE